MTTPRTRGRFPRFAGRLVAMGAAAGLTVLLAQSTTTAAFTGTTGDAGNQATTATTFCPSAGNATLTPVADTAVYQSSSGTNYGNGSIGVGVGTTTTANAYSYIKFDLAAAAIPARCTVTAATLTIRAAAANAGGTLQVYRADAAWNPATMTWATGRVGFTGTPATTASRSSAGPQTWDVTALTRELRAGTNNGFALRDSADSAASARYQTWDSMESGIAANRPQLVLTWG
jgi:hypothetical protein